MHRGGHLMRTPQRNDVYANPEGQKVVVNNVLAPNANGTQVLEFKQIGATELYFLPLDEFVEKYEFVETFASFDTYLEERNRQLQIKEEEEAKAALLRKQAKEAAASAVKR